MALTEDQWYAHPSFRKELEELLRNKTLQVALEIVNKRGLKPTLFPEGLNLMHYFALMGSKRDGYFESLANLEALSKPKPAPAPERKPFESPKPKPDGDRTSAP